MNDLKFAFRQLLKNPGFTAAAVLTLALGIGANTAVFSAVNSLWLRALPFPDSDRLVLAWGRKPQQGRDKIPFSWPNFADLRAQGRSFENLGVWALGRANLTGDDNPEQVQQAIVSAGFFSTMGVAPILGRTFLPSEDERGGEKVAVLSHSLWQRRFGSDANIVGRSIPLDEQGYRVVGVMPASFRFLSFPRDTEVWIPIGLDPFTDRRFARAVNSLGVIGRLKAGIGLAQAQAEAEAIARPLAEQYPENKGWEITLVALKEQVVANYRLALLVLAVAVGFVLLIGCANVANLLLARASARHREIAIRSALGASRGRVIRQLLTENLLLSALGGGLGLLLAHWTVELLRAFPQGVADFTTRYRVPREQVGLDARVVWFAAGLSCLTALIFGLAPSLGASRTDLNNTLKAAVPTTSSGPRPFGLRSWLVTGEVALSLVLLISAGLLIRGFTRLQEMKPGFQPDNLLTANISLPKTKYPQGDQITGFYERVLERIARLPGVTAAGAVEYLPLNGIDGSAFFLIEGEAEPPPGEERRAHHRNITPGYFKAMGIPLVQGRDFTERDSSDAPKVAIINQTMARRYWPNENPPGKRAALVFEALRFRPDGPPELDIKLGLREIVGVVQDVKHTKLDAASVPEIYLPLAQRPVNDMTLVVRTQTEPTGLIPQFRPESGPSIKPSPCPASPP